jgi:hypothetical protein
MTDNPLISRQTATRSTYTVEAHVAQLNVYNWVHASGKPFYVGERTKASGLIERFVDRGN